MGKLPYISRIHTAYIGEYLHFRYLKSLVILDAPKKGGGTKLQSFFGHSMFMLMMLMMMMMMNSRHYMMTYD